MHDFAASVKASDMLADAAWWELLYRSAFGDRFRHMEKVDFDKDPLLQRRGIDRIVYLDGGAGTLKPVLVDEKYRSQEWPDILLEIWSDRDRKHPGWAIKPLHCDYIAYAFPLVRRAHLIPFLAMQRALRTCWHEWWSAARECSGGFRVVDATNTTYTTRSLAVPVDALLSAIADATRVSWE